MSDPGAFRDPRIFTRADDPLVAAARFLQSQLEWLRHAVADNNGEPYAVHAFAEIEACASRLRGLVEGPRERVYLGPCGALVLTPEPWEPGTPASETCDGDIYAPRGGTIGRCRTCKATVPAEDRRAWLDGEVRAHAFTDVWIAEALRIPVKTIRSWATERAEVRNHEGKLARSATPAKLPAHGHDRDGRALYLLGDVADLAADSAARREEQRSRRAAAQATTDERMSA